MKKAHAAACAFYINCYSEYSVLRLAVTIRYPLSSQPTAMTITSIIDIAIIIFLVFPATMIFH